MILLRFPSGMRTYHEEMPDISRASSEIVSMLSYYEVNCFLIYYCESQLPLFFCSLVSKDDLRNQYPNAGGLIACLPASWVWCFKPEAHLLIEKFLSLEKETSRKSFIANMAQHSRARHEVWSIFLSSEECSSHLSQSNHFFRSLPQWLVPQWLLPQKSVALGPSQLVFLGIYKYTLKLSRYRILCCRTCYSSCHQILWSRRVN